MCKANKLNHIIELKGIWLCVPYHPLKVNNRIINHSLPCYKCYQLLNDVKLTWRNVELSSNIEIIIGRCSIIQLQIFIWISLMCFIFISSAMLRTFSPMDWMRFEINFIDLKWQIPSTASGELGIDKLGENGSVGNICAHCVANEAIAERNVPSRQHMVH